MSFGTITTATSTFNERANGTYVDADVNFGAPLDEMRIRPNSASKAPTATVSRYKQVDFLAAGASTPQRVSATAVLSISIPPNGITTAALSEMVSEISQFCTPANLSRVLQGEA